MVREENKQLHVACMTGNVTDFKKALELGADVNSKNDDGDTPLCLVSKCRFDLVKLLIEKGADVNLLSDNLISPLHWAVEFDNEEIVEFLLKNGAKHDLQDRLLETPLHWAAWTGHHKSAKILIAYGANDTKKNCGGYTPLDLATLQGHQEVMEVLKNNNIWRSLGMNLLNDGKIRPFEQSDGQAVLQILKEPGGHFYTLEKVDFSDYQESHVYEVKHEILGFVCLEIHPKISQIICYVSPRYRCKGIGSKLFAYALDRLKELDPNTIWFFFRNDVGQSAKFYQNRGALPWYSYHHMLFDDKNKESFHVEQAFDKVIKYTDDYFEEYLDGRARAFIKINKLIDSRPHDERDRKDEIKKWTERNSDKIWLFFKDNQLVGSLALYDGFFDELFVIPEYQTKGLGKNIVLWALNYCFTNGYQPELSVVSGNIPAIKLYEKAGFKIAQTLEMNRLFSTNKAPDLRGPIGG